MYRHKSDRQTDRQTELVQESYLPQTDHASAFDVEPVEIFLASTLITMQNLVVVSHTVCAHKRSQKFRGRWAYRPLSMGACMANPKTHAPDPYVLAHQIRSLYVKPWAL